MTDEPDDELEDEQDEDDDPSTVLPSAFIDRLATLIAETPEERAQRLQVEREAAFIAHGETRSEREARHRAERKAAERAATAMWRQDHAERAKRFRKWVLLTAVSAGIGWQLRLPQALAHVPMPVTVAVWLAAAWMDWHLRDHGRVRVSSVRGPLRLVVLIVVRAPLASALLAVLRLVPTHH